MKVEVDLTGIVPDPEALVLTKTDPCVEHMLHAIESPRGIAIDAGESQKAAERLRFRFYRARRRAQAAGNTSFDNLVMTLDEVQGIWRVKIVNIIMPSTVTEL